MALTSSQAPALSSVALPALLQTSSPIILDLNGGGPLTQSIANGVKFDMFNTGQAVNTGWVSSTDGLLVLDRNNDGVINNSSELFGTSTVMSNGTTAVNGYAALQALDADGDGVIDKNDAAFADLKVWIDSNSDGVTQAGELHTLSSLGIASISTQAVTSTAKDNGNLVGLTSTYQTTSGATHDTADVWFLTTPNSAIAAATATPSKTVDQAIAALATTAPAAAAVPLVVSQLTASGAAAAVAPAIVPPIAADAVTPPAVTVPGNLRTQVSSMAQAITAYSGGDVTTAASIALTAGAQAAATPTAVAVSSMVSAMQQFDANGNPVMPQLVAATPTVPVLNLTGTQAPAATLAASPLLKPPGA